MLDWVRVRGLAGPFKDSQGFKDLVVFKALLCCLSVLGCLVGG